MAMRTVLYSNMKNTSYHKPNMDEVVSTLAPRPTKLFTNTFLQSGRVIRDILTYNKIWKENVRLLGSIQHPKRDMSSYNYFVHKKMRKGITDAHRLQLIEQDNHRLGCRILSARPHLRTRENLPETENKYPVPGKTLEKYKTVVLRTERRLLSKLLRPNIVFHLEVKDLHPIGRITAQLFTEACPALVLALVRLCGEKKSDRWKFTRIFHNLWADSVILLDQSSPLTQGCIEHDMHVLDQASSAGVFSFGKQYLKGFKSGYAHFSISFRPITTLEGRRVPFGIITNGLKYFDILQEYGTKNGNILKKIVVTKCGMFF